MAEGKELKPRSFRIDDETLQKFKDISNSIGDESNRASQQDTMQILINAYYMQTQKSNLAEHKANIEEFERYATSIITMYTQALQENHDMKQTVMQEFDALLKSKDLTIQDLQGKLNMAKQLQKDATQQSKEYADENLRLNEAINRLNDEYGSKVDGLQAMLSDKDSLNKALTDSCNGLKIKIESMEEAVARSEVLQGELDKLKKEYDEVAQERSALKAKIQQEQDAHEKMVSELRKHEADALEQLKVKMQIAQEKAILQTEKTYQEQIQKLKADKQAEVDKYQQKYFDLLEQLKNQTAPVGLN